MHSGEETNNKTVGKHYRPRQGVPFAVTALLVVLALICGGVAGYLGGSRFSDVAKRLTAAEQRIEEYELMVAGLYTEQYDDEKAAEEAAAAENEGTAALTGKNVIESEAAEVFVVVEYDGGAIMSDEAALRYEQALSDRAMAGEDVSAATGDILNEVLEDMARERIAYIKAQELGFTEYSDQDSKSIDALAQAEYDDTVSFYAGGSADEATIASAQQYLADAEGYTLEGVRAGIEQDYWQTKLYDYIIADVKVDADDISALYNERLAEQQEAFDTDPAAFETALMSGEIVVYNPAGYRTVKQIFFALDETSAARAAEINAQMETETDENVRAELQTELDALYAPLEEKAAQAIAEFEGGTDFDALIDKYGDEGTLSAGAFYSTGYYISANTTMWPAAFVEAGMALAAPGDVSPAVRSEDGVHVVRYIANVESGSVPLSNVSSRLTTETQSVEKQRAYDAQLQTWMDEANVQYYPERMN